MIVQETFGVSGSAILATWKLQLRHATSDVGRVCAAIRQQVLQVRRVQTPNERFQPAARMFRQASCCHVSVGHCRKIMQVPNSWMMSVPNFDSSSSCGRTGRDHAA